MNHSNRLVPPLFALALALSSAGAGARAGAPADTPAAVAASAADTASWTEGEVRKVDLDAGKLTLRHGAIEHLGMGPMTMVFRAADPALLRDLKPGDRVRFMAEDRSGALTVTRVEKRD